MSTQHTATNNIKYITITCCSVVSSNDMVTSITTCNPTIIHYTSTCDVIVADKTTVQCDTCCRL